MLFKKSVEISTGLLHQSPLLNACRQVESSVNFKIKKKKKALHEQIACDLANYKQLV